MKSVISLLAVAWLLSAQAACLAQVYPAKPIKLIVPLAAGGTGDTLARTVGDAMARELGQPVVVDNRPGAGGLLGTTSVMNAPADGYTLLAVSPSHVINPALHANSTYDPLGDFEPITVLAYTHQAIVVHPSVSARTLQELIAYAKQNPGKLNYGSAGTGSATHLNMELLKSMAGVHIVHVPYKGSTQARQAVLAGEVQIAVDGLLPLQPLIKDGRLKVLAVTSSKRPQSNPDIPTVGETIPGYASDTWYGLLARTGTPKNAIPVLHQAAVKALQSPAISEELKKLGAEPAGNTPAAFRAFLAQEQKLWAKVLKDSGTKAQ
jgi:tripartite-type tricarboxylate transporter receptor subunit TctC